MRIVIGVDPSEEAVAAVEQVGLLYRPDEVVLVHGVALPTAANAQRYNAIRQALMETGHQAIERCRTLLPAETPSIRTLHEIQDPASFILDSADTVKADLIAVGTRGHSRAMAVIIGSVSHQVLLLTTVPILVVKGKARPVTRILMAVEGQEDATRLQTWLTAHPFKNPVAVTILSVVPPLQNIGTQLMGELEAWSEQNKRDAQQALNDAAQALASPHFAVSTDVRLGDPVMTVCEVGTNHDLIVISSHGRKGLSRLMLGSVSEGIVHGADCSVLVVR